MTPLKTKVVGEDLHPTSWFMTETNERIAFGNVYCTMRCRGILLFKKLSFDV